MKKFSLLEQVETLQNKLVISSNSSFILHKNSHLVPHKTTQF